MQLTQEVHTSVHSFHIFPRLCFFICFSHTLRTRVCVCVRVFFYYTLPASTMLVLLHRIAVYDIGSVHAHRLPLAGIMLHAHHIIFTFASKWVCSSVRNMRVLQI